MNFFLGDFLKKDPDKSFIINYAPLFANLNLFDKKLIIEKSKVVEYKKDDIIYRQSDPADAFYCVITGRVRIFNIKREARVILEYLNCGKYFGIISLLTGELHSVNAEAASDSKILRIDKEDFKLILNKIPKLAIDLSKALSRRLRKKDIQEKRIFESSIIFVSSLVRETASFLYANNLAKSLKKETARNVILINVLQGAKEAPKTLNLTQKHFLSDSAIKEDIVKEPDSAIFILNIAYDSLNSQDYAVNFNFLLASLTNEFHFILVYLPVLASDAVSAILSQSDTIHLITDCDVKSLEETKALISGLLGKVNYPPEQIKIILNTERGGKSFSSEEVSKLLDSKIYATLPVRPETAGNALLEEPHREYASAIRRIAREVGDVRVGLALSGGAAFGLAHIGVIRSLEKEGIPIDAVAGSSIGALIGALWASGLNSEELKKVSLEFNTKKGISASDRAVFA